MLTTRRCVSALAIVGVCAAARSLAAQATVPSGCKCSVQPPELPPSTGPVTAPGEGGHRHHSRRIPPLAPLGLVGFLMGASSDIPGAGSPSAAPVASAPTGDTLRMAEVADSTRPADARSVSAFRARVESLAQGLRAPDTASWLPTLVAGGVVLMGAGAALLRKPRA